MEIQRVNSSLKVLHFVHWSRSGITSLVKYLNEYSVNTKTSLLLLTNDSDFQEYYKQINNKLQLCSNSQFSSAFLGAIKFYKKITPDIVHAHSFTPLLISCLLFWRTKIIFHVHNYYPYFYEKNIKAIIKRVILKILFFRQIHILTVSNEVKEYFNQYYGKNAIFLKNCIPDIGKERELFTERPHQGRFYNVSRLHKDKNLSYAIELINALVVRGHNVTLDIYGVGGEESYLQKLIDERCLEHTIKMMGFTENPESLAENYDFYISTSLIEGMGLSMINALRGRTPVIMTPRGELVNILKDDITSCFINFNLTESTNKIEKLITNPNDKLAKIQSGGRNIFIDKFSIQSFINEIEEIYSAITR